MTLIDFLFPSRCLVCRSFFSGGVFCSTCYAQFPFCVDRLEAPPPFGKMTALGYYRGILLDLVGRMKYSREERIAELFGDWLGERLRENGKFDLIIPVPLHSRRLRERGFNQAGVIARRIGRKIGVPVENRLLVRNRETPAQTRLTRAERTENLSGAFQILDEGWVAEKKVLLVDDVYTTGATLLACAIPLRKAGVEGIEIAVAARTP